MPHRHAIRVALAVGLAATTLAAPNPTAAPPADIGRPSAVEAVTDGVPAVALLSGAAHTTATPGKAPAGVPAAIALALTAAHCPSHPTADGTPPAPCPAQPGWTNPTTFAVVKQPHPSVDQHATPAGGPAAPALLLLDQLRPRGDLPASRTTHLDPRPA